MTAYFVKREYLDPTAPKGKREREEIIEVTAKSYANILKAKPKVREGVEQALIRGFGKADHQHSEPPATPEEYANTRFMFPATQEYYAQKLGITASSGAVVAKATPVAVKDNPALRAELAGKDIAALRDYLKEKGWEESEYANYKLAGLLLEKIIQKSLETEVVK